MSVVKSVIVYSERPWTDGLVKRRYEVTLTDNLGTDHVAIVGMFKVDPLDDGADVANNHLQSRKAKELGAADIVPLWNNTQADYDRRSLGQAMTLSDAHEFYDYLPLFQAMESRSGSNINARVATLGVIKSDYTLMANRFGDVQGIAFFLDNAKGQIWAFDQVPVEFEQ